MNKLYCIACPNGCLLTLIGSGPGLIVEGNKCDKGVDFAKAELEDPKRTLTTTVRTNFPDVPVISVRTAGEIPKNSIEDAIKEINDVVVDQELGVGDVVIEDVADTGVSVIITSPALMKLGAELENKNADVSRSNSASPSGGAAVTADIGNATVMDMAAEGVLDDIGGDAADGFVGAAGEAVGVDTTGDESSEGGKNGKGGKDSKERANKRARVKIN